MPDAEFEKTLADLAHARLRDRAPGLLDYIVGFQLLDKSDDNTHAVGVWGFKVGNEWMYAPVFFLNGQLKGDELLYLKSQDAFVPLKENWVNYLLNRRPHILGDAEPMQQNELGIRQPDFDVLARPPYTGSKYASAGTLRTLTDYLASTVDHNFRDFLPVIMASPGGEKWASLDTKWHLTNFLKSASPILTKKLLDTMRKNAEFAESVLKFYRMEDIVSAAREVFSKKAADGDRYIKNTAPPVQMFIGTATNIPNVLGDITLTDAEKERMLHDKFVVRDNRGDDQVSRVYNRRINLTLQNPTCNGIYATLFNAGEFKPMLTIVAPHRLGGSGFRGTKEGLSVLIDPETRKTKVCPPQDIYTDGGCEDKEAMQKLYDKLPAASSVSTGDIVVFVNEKGDGTLPYKVMNKITTESGQQQLYGSVITPNEPHESFDRQQFFPDRQPAIWNESRMTSKTQHCIILTNKNGMNITQIGDDLFVPNGYKALKVNQGELPDTIDPQTLADVQMEMFKSADVHTISPVTDGIEWWLKVDGDVGQPMSKLSAMKELVIRHGLREKQAQALLKLASRNSPPEFMIKYAAPTAPAFPEPAMATDPDIGNVPVQYPQTNLLSANPDEIPSYGEPYMDMSATYNAQQAAQLDQKEVLDTSVISGLIKTMDPNAVIDSYVGDLMLGLDRIGRILFMYYWHYEKFKDRYGSQDMPELEDMLKNIFDGLGDLVLFVKQKTIEPDISGATAEAELPEVL